MKKILLFFVPILLVASELNIYSNPKLNYDVYDEKLNFDNDYGIEIKTNIKNFEIDLSTKNEREFLGNLNNRLLLSQSSIRGFDVNKTKKMIKQYDGFKIELGLGYNILEENKEDYSHKLNLKSKFTFSKNFSKIEIQTNYDFFDTKKDNKLKFSIEDYLFDYNILSFNFSDELKYNINDKLILVFDTDNRLKYDKINKFNVLTDTKLGIKVKFDKIDTLFGTNFRLSNYYLENKRLTDILIRFYTDINEEYKKDNLSLVYGSKIGGYIQMNEKTNNLKDLNYGFYFTPELNIKYKLNDKLQTNLSIISEYVLKDGNFSDFNSILTSFKEMNLIFKGGITYSF